VYEQINKPAFERLFSFKNYFKKMLRPVPVFLIGVNEVSLLTNCFFYKSQFY